MVRHSLMLQLESVACLAGVGFRGAVVAGAAVFCGCGYQLVSPDAPHSDGSVTYCVRSSDAASVHPNAVAWLRAGTLDGLSQWKLTGECDGGPTIVLGPVQVSFDAAAVVDGLKGTDGAGPSYGIGAPVARAARVMVRGEAHVVCCDSVEADCNEADFDTDSVGARSGRRCERVLGALNTCGKRFFSQGQQIVASEGSAPGHIVSMDAAVQRAAWEAGQQLAKQVAMAHVAPVSVVTAVPQRVEIKK